MNTQENTADSTRDALEAAFEEHDTEEGEEETVEIEAEETAEVEEVVEDVEPEEPDEEPEPIAAEVETETEAVEEAEEETEEIVSRETVEVPASWSPAARETWGELPAAAQAEIAKREREVEQVLGRQSQEVSRAREFENAIEPFKQTIALEANGDAIMATRNLMGIATRLRGGTQVEKAQLLGQIIQTYGVDIQTLDDVLSGTAAAGVATSPATAHPVAPAVATDPRIDQMWNAMQAQEATRQQQAENDVEQFLNAQEFGADVRNDMADVMEFANRRNESLTLEQAYERALAMRPDIQQVLASRTATQSNQESLKRKKRAAKQIKGTPSTDPSAVAPPEDLHGAIAQAWDDIATSS